MAPIRGAWVERLDAAIRNERALAPTVELKAVAITAKEQSATGGVLTDALRFNGRSGAENRSRGALVEKVVDLTQPVDFRALAGEVLAVGADIVVVANMGRILHFQLLPEIEANWPSSKPRPRYVLSGDEAFSAHFQRSVGANDELRRRVSGATVFVSDPKIDENLFAYIDAFRKNAQFGYDPNQISTGFEAFYVAAFALTAAVNAATVNPGGVRGGDVVEGIKRLRADPSAVVVDVRASDVARGVRLLSDKERIDLRGVNSTLEWDATTGELPTDSSIFCVRGDFSFGDVWIYDGQGKKTLGEPKPEVCGL